MARVIEPTNDAGYMVADRIEPVLASPGASIYGQVILATVCSGSQNQDTFVASFHCFSYSQGDNPPLYLCGLIWLYQFCSQL